MPEPAHGYTKRGAAVHGRTVDHHPSHSAYTAFNKKAAIWITEHVGTMTCCWLFCLLALCSLPATLVAARVVSGGTFKVGGLYLASAGLILLVTWLAQSFLQLTLLPALMVGQNLQMTASDARTSRQFEDTEEILDRLDLQTTGGLRAATDEIIAAMPKAAARAPTRRKAP